MEKMSGSVIKKFLLPILFSLTLILTSCGAPKTYRMDVSDMVYYFEAPRDYTLGDIIKHKYDFRYLQTSDKFNTTKLLKSPDHTYLWLRIEFDIPEELQNRGIGLFIGQLRSASRLYLNGNLVRQYGNLPPHEFGIGLQPQYYMFQDSGLLQEGKNTIYMQIWTGGWGTLSNTMFIGEQRDVSYTANRNQFFISDLNLAFTAAMLIVFAIYVALYLTFKNKYKDNSYYMVFALLNLYSSRFLFPIYAGNFGWIIGAIPYIWFLKIWLFNSAFITIYFSNSFIIRFLNYKENKSQVMIRLSLLTVAIIINSIQKTYTDLYKMLPLTLGIALLNYYYSIPCILKAFFKDKTKRKDAIKLLLCFTPVMITLPIDIVDKLFIKDNLYIFYTIYGWQVTIILFLIELISHFNKISLQNITLNEKLKTFATTLEAEVKTRTEELTNANANLSKGLETVSFVQQNSLPRKQRSFDNWEISAEYVPLSHNVSGDLFDYYALGQKLMGMSLFDVSGHGISAGLMTILAKGIVSSIFWNGIEKNENASQLLTRINQTYCDEKGNIEHYMTGLLFQMNETVDGGCTLELANAGHPYPLIYKASTNTVSELCYKGHLPQYGLIGIDDMEVSFQLVTEEIQENDIIICYTDGLTESTNDKNEEFGVEHAKRILLEHYNESAADISGKILESFNEFTKNSKHKDDFTLLVLKRGNSEDFIEEL